MSDEHKLKTSEEYTEMARKRFNEITGVTPPKDQIIAYARQIAIYRGYTNLVNGLQPADKLEEKNYAEWLELREAVAHKSHLHQLHEAADIYYYGCQLEAQTATPYLVSALASLRRLHLDKADVEAAALAKYGYRASAPNMKDESHELDLIAKAIKK